MTSAADVVATAFESAQNVSKVLAGDEYQRLNGLLSLWLTVFSLTGALVLLSGVVYVYFSIKLSRASSTRNLSSQDFTFAIGGFLSQVFAPVSTFFAWLNTARGFIFSFIATLGAQGFILVGLSLALFFASTFTAEFLAVYATAHGTIVPPIRSFLLSAVQVVTVQLNAFIPVWNFVSVQLVGRFLTGAIFDSLKCSPATWVDFIERIQDASSALNIALVQWAVSGSALVAPPDFYNFGASLANLSLSIDVFADCMCNSSDVVVEPLVEALTTTPLALSTPGAVATLGASPYTLPAGIPFALAVNATFNIIPSLVIDSTRPIAGTILNWLSGDTFIDGYVNANPNFNNTFESIRVAAGASGATADAIVGSYVELFTGFGAGPTDTIIGDVDPGRPPPLFACLADGFYTLSLQVPHQALNLAVRPDKALLTFDGQSMIRARQGLEQIEEAFAHCPRRFVAWIGAVMDAYAYVDNGDVACSDDDTIYDAPGGCAAALTFRFFANLTEIPIQSMISFTQTASVLSDLVIGTMWTLGYRIYDFDDFDCAGNTGSWYCSVPRDEIITDFLQYQLGHRSIRGVPVPDTYRCPDVICGLESCTTDDDCVDTQLFAVGRECQFFGDVGKCITTSNAQSEKCSDAAKVDGAFVESDCALNLENDGSPGVFRLGRCSTNGDCAPYAWSEAYLPTCSCHVNEYRETLRAWEGIVIPVGIMLDDLLTVQVPVLELIARRGSRAFSDVVLYLIEYGADSVAILMRKEVRITVNELVRSALGLCDAFRVFAEAIEASDEARTILIEVLFEMISLYCTAIAKAFELLVYIIDIVYRLLANLSINGVDTITSLLRLIMELVINVLALGLNYITSLPLGFVATVTGSTQISDATQILVDLYRSFVDSSDALAAVLEYLVTEALPCFQTIFLSIVGLPTCISSGTTGLCGDLLTSIGECATQIITLFLELIDSACDRCFLSDITCFLQTSLCYFNIYPFTDENTNQLSTEMAWCDAPLSVAACQDLNFLCTINDVVCFLGGDLELTTCSGPCNGFWNSCIFNELVCTVDKGLGAPIYVIEKVLTAIRDAIDTIISEIANLAGNILQFFDADDDGSPEKTEQIILKLWPFFVRSTIPDECCKNGSEFPAGSEVWLLENCFDVNFVEIELSSIANQDYTGASPIIPTCKFVLEGCWHNIFDAAVRGDITVLRFMGMIGEAANIDTINVREADPEFEGTARYDRKGARRFRHMYNNLKIFFDDEPNSIAAAYYFIYNNCGWIIGDTVQTVSITSATIDRLHASETATFSQMSVPMYPDGLQVSSRIRSCKQRVLSSSRVTLQPTSSTFSSTIGTLTDVICEELVEEFENSLAYTDVLVAYYGHDTLMRAYFEDLNSRPGAPQIMSRYYNATTDTYRRTPRPLSYTRLNEVFRPIVFAVETGIHTALMLGDYLTKPLPTSLSEEGAVLATNSYVGAPYFQTQVAKLARPSKSRRAAAILADLLRPASIPVRYAVGAVAGVATPLTRGMRENMAGSKPRMDKFTELLRNASQAVVNSHRGRQEGMRLMRTGKPINHAQISLQGIQDRLSAVGYFLTATKGASHAQAKYEINQLLSSATAPLVATAPPAVPRSSALRTIQYRMNYRMQTKLNSLGPSLLNHDTDTFSRFASPFVCSDDQPSCLDCSVIDRLMYEAWDGGTRLDNYYQGEFETRFSRCASERIVSVHNTLIPSGEACPSQFCAIPECERNLDCQQSSALLPTTSSTCNTTLHRCVVHSCQGVSRNTPCRTAASGSMCNFGSCQDSVCVVDSVAECDCKCPDTYLTPIKRVPSILTRFSHIEVPCLLNTTCIRTVVQAPGAEETVKADHALRGSFRDRKTMGGTVENFEVTVLESIGGDFIEWLEDSVHALRANTGSANIRRFLDAFWYCDYDAGWYCPLRNDSPATCCGDRCELRAPSGVQGVGLFNGALWAALTVLVPVVVISVVPVLAQLRILWIVLMAVLFFPLTFHYAYGGGLACYIGGFSVCTGSDLYELASEFLNPCTLLDPVLFDRTSSNAYLECGLLDPSNAVRLPAIKDCATASELSETQFTTSIDGLFYLLEIVVPGINQVLADNLGHFGLSALTPYAEAHTTEAHASGGRLTHYCGVITLLGVPGALFFAALKGLGTIIVTLLQQTISPLLIAPVLFALQAVVVTVNQFKAAYVYNFENETVELGTQAEIDEAEDEVDPEVKKTV